jgi:hypothetical protein
MFNRLEQAGLPMCPEGLSQQIAEQPDIVAERFMWIRPFGPFQPFGSFGPFGPFGPFASFGSFGSFESFA